MTADLQSSVPLSLDVLFNWLFLISLQLRLNEIFPKGTFKAVHDIHTIKIIHPTHNEIDQDNNNWDGVTLKSSSSVTEWMNAWTTTIHLS